MMSCAVTVALTTLLVHTHNSLISGTDVVDILEVVDAEWDQGQAAEPKPNCNDENHSTHNPSQKARSNSKDKNPMQLFMLQPWPL